MLVSCFRPFCWSIEDAMQDELNDLLSRKRQRFQLVGQRFAEGDNGHTSCYPMAGIPPSCCIKPRASRSAHCSAILPPPQRKISVPVNITCFPVGEKTLKGPLMRATPGVANRYLVPLGDQVLSCELEVGEGGGVSDHQLL